MVKTKEELQEQLDCLRAAGANVIGSTALDKMIIDKKSSFYHPSYRGLPQKQRKTRYPYHYSKYHIDHKVGVPLRGIPKSYTTDVLNFIGYLDDTAQKTFTIKGIDLSTGEETIKIKPYVHRWTEIYSRGFLCKMYQLENALCDDIRDITMITLTVRHTRKTAEECLYLLREKWTKLRKVLGYYFGTIDFFRAFEPHKSGFPHMHILYMKHIPGESQKDLKKLWSEKYEMGDEAHGIHFLAPRASKNGTFESGSIGRIRGYIMGYVSKSLCPSSDAPDYDYCFTGRHHTLKYAPNYLLFNSLLKKTKTRLWGASRNFSKIMAYVKNPALNWQCTQVIQTGGDRDVLVWDKDAGLRPEVVKAWKWRNTLPSWSLSVGQTLEDYKLHGYKLEEFEQIENGKPVKFTRIFEPTWVPA